MEVNEKVKNNIWVEKYRPKKISDCIVPSRIESFLKSILSSKEMPHLIFSGPPGVGKTTVAKALCNELDCDVMVINGSDESGIDVLRTKIKTFASSISLKKRGMYKVVILDEGDYLNPNSTQPALRNFMEEFSKNCRFIITCNYLSKIIDPLQSRCSVVNFGLDTKEKKDAFLKMLARAWEILDAESVPYDKKVVAKILQKNLPDFRRAINELQLLSKTGNIGTECLGIVSQYPVKKLFEALKNKKFDAMKEWVLENANTDHNTIYSEVYKHLGEFVVPEFIPIAIIKIHDYMYRASFVANSEINLMACMLELMADCEFK